MSNDRKKKPNAPVSDHVTHTGAAHPGNVHSGPGHAPVDQSFAPPLVPAGGVFHMFSRHWKLIAALAVIGALIAWAIAAAQPRRYRASAVAAVAPAADTLSAGEVLRGVEVLERRTVVATVAALASTTSIRDAAAGGASGDFSIDGSVLPNTNLFRVTVESPDAARAAAIANRIPALLSEQTRAMFRYYVVTTVSPATQPSAPFLPRTGRSMITGLLVGLFLGLIAAWIADRSRTAHVG